MKRTAHGGNRAKRRARHFGSVSRQFWGWRWQPLQVQPLTEQQVITVLERCFERIEKWEPPRLILAMKTRRPQS